MNSELIVHIFSSLQTLEKYLAAIKNNAPTAVNCEKYAALIPQQEAVLRHMRRIANNLQLEVARKQEPLAFRSLKVFYGLHHMVRKDLTEAFAALSQKTPPVPAPPHPAGKELIYH